MVEDNCRRWYLKTLRQHSSNLFKELIYDDNLTSKNLKYVDDFRTEEGSLITPLKGFFASKDMTKYWLDELYNGVSVKEILPLKTGDNTEILTYKDDVVVRVLKPTPFRIKPELKIPFRELVDGFVPFKHSNQSLWTLMKLVVISSLVSQDFTCIASPSSFGKSAIYKALNYVTDKCPVYKPRTVPGALNQLNGDGNNVYDEAQKCNSQIREVMEDLALRLADGSKEYINGALKSAQTKKVYDCRLQSLTFLYNNLDHYSNPESDYFDVVWVNPSAMRNRFLQLKFEGVLEHDWNGSFNLLEEADNNKMYYIDFAKTILYLQGLKTTNNYNKRFNSLNHEPVIKLTQRQLQTYNNYLWIIDLYCYDGEEFKYYKSLLDDCIRSYEDMVISLTNNSGLELESLEVETLK